LPPFVAWLLTQFGIGPQAGKVASVAGFCGERLQPASRTIIKTT
jgi:hypothetical protein